MAPLQAQVAACLLALAVGCLPDREVAFLQGLEEVFQLARVEDSRQGREADCQLDPAEDCRRDLGVEVPKSPALIPALFALARFF